MNASQLYRHFLSFCSQHDILVKPDPGSAAIQFAIEHLGVTVPGTVLCEDHPPTLQIILRVPVTVIHRQRPRVLNALNRLNLNARFGSFQMNPDDGAILFRSAFPIRGQRANVGNQIAEAFATSIDHFCKVARSLCLIAAEATLPAIEHAAGSDIPSPMVGAAPWFSSFGDTAPHGLN